MSNIRSHVGQIIFSSKLDTMEKVIDIYGGKKWTKIEGKFLLGQSRRYEIDSTGGEESHVLTEEEMPSHRHGFKETNLEYGDSDFFTFQTSGQSKFYRKQVEESTSAIGKGQPHNNMPPYRVVYIWERTE